MMGGNASTRRVVVENTGHQEYITISEAVARRLTGQPDLNFTSKNRATASVSHSLTDDREHPMSSLLKNKDVEDFYVQKLQDLHERNASLQKVTNEQFAAAVKEVEQKLINVTPTPVCQDLQAQVFDCYQGNPGEILSCSAIVNAFSKCVDRARIAAATSRIRRVS